MFQISGDNLDSALTILSIATLAGLALTRGTVINLRESLEDAREEIKDKARRHTEEMAEKDQRLAKAETTIDHQGSQIRGQQHDLEALGRVVTGEAHWESITRKLNEHHTRAEEHWQRDEELLTDISHRLGGGTG